MVGPEGLGRAGVPAASADRLRPADYEELGEAFTAAGDLRKGIDFCHTTSVKLRNRTTFELFSVRNLQNKAPT